MSTPDAPALPARDGLDTALAVRLVIALNLAGAVALGALVHMALTDVTLSAACQGSHREVHLKDPPAEPLQLVALHGAATADTSRAVHACRLSQASR
jgi:hypothetical protein